MVPYEPHTIACTILFFRNSFALFELLQKLPFSSANLLVLQHPFRPLPLYVASTNMCPHQNQFFCACAPVAGFRPEELPSPITLTVEDAPEMIRNVSGSSAGSCSSIDISESCNAFYLLPFSPGPCGATPKVSKPRPRSWSSPTPPQLPVDSSYLEFHRRGSDDLGDREVVAPDMLPNTAQPKAIGSSSAVFSTATPALFVHPVRKAATFFALY